MKYLQGVAISSIALLVWPAYAIIGGDLPSASDPSAKSTVILFKFDPLKQITIARCSASLLAPDLIVTAAHCLYLDHDTNRNQLTPSQLIVYLGGYSANPGLYTSRTIPVQAVRVHPGYTASFHAVQENRHDLALVKLVKPVDQGFQPAEILDPSQAIEKYETPIVGGYGGTNNGHDEEGGKYYVYNNYFVESPPESGASMVELLGPRYRGCYDGDSGGPAFLEDRTGHLKLWGVFSSYVLEQGIADYEDLRASRTWITFASAALGSPIPL